MSNAKLYVLLGTVLGIFVSPGRAAEPPRRPAAVGGAANPEVDPDAIRHWIADLDDELYVVRERAMANLMKAGAAAIEPLAVAADGPNLEAASRAVHVLLKLGEAENTELGAAALQRVAALKNRPVERGLAAAVLAGVREKRAVAEIKRLGGVQEDQLLFDGRTVFTQLKLGENWKGGDDGLALLRDLQSLQILRVHSAPISDKGLVHIRAVSGLSRLELFGTSVSDRAVEDLRKALPGTEIHFRYGALLGIGGEAHPQGAQVIEVQAGSAADNVGIRIDDVITRFNGQRFEGFQGLTALIAKCRPGDRATLDVIRAGETFRVEVTFGKWK